MEEEIKKGDVVRLKSEESNARKFTVGAISGKEGEVYVYWFDRTAQELKTKLVPAACLCKIK